MQLRGSHVLITGASRGIGAAMAKELAIRGASLSLVARSVDTLKAVAEQTGGNAHVADLTDRSVVDALIDDVEATSGPVDVLINNAGLETSAPFDAVDSDLIRQVINLNLEAPMVLTRRVLPGMLERDRGHLFFTSSLAGTGAFPGLAAYCATKAGLTNFAATVRLELRDTNINTTVVAPGPVDTGMWDNLLDASELEPMVDRLEKFHLIPKVAPAKIARLSVDAIEADRAYVGLPKRLAVNHLLRNAPSAITGAILRGVQVGPRP